MKCSKICLSLFLVAAVSITVLSCGGGGGGPSTPQVSYNASTGEVKAPGSQIVYSGEVKENVASVPPNSLVGIYKDEKAYFFHTAMRDSSLSEETSRRAIGYFIGSVPPNPGPSSHSGELKTGLGVTPKEATTYTFTNLLKRWAGVKNSVTDEAHFVMPPGDILEVDFIGALQNSSIGDLIQIRPLDNTEMVVRASESAETYGSIIRIRPLIPILPSLKPELYSSIQEAAARDPDFFLKLNTVDYMDLLFAGLQQVTSVVVPNNCVDTAIQPIISTFELVGIDFVVGGDEELRQKFATQMGNTVITALAQCHISFVCAGVTGGLCLLYEAFVDTFLDIVGNVSWVIDNFLISSWDTLAHLAFLEWNPVSPPPTITLSVYDADVSVTNPLTPPYVFSTPGNAYFTVSPTGLPTPLTYEWRFGDLPGGAVQSTLANPTHIFAELGNYNVTVVVEDAQNNSHSTNAFIQVNAGEYPSSIIIEPASASVAVGGTVQFKALGNYSGGRQYDITNAVTWNSSNLAVGGFGVNNALGLFTAAANGTTTITAVFHGVTSNSATVVVSPGYMLAVTKSGTGSGTVTSNPPGIDCGSTCSATFPSGQTVTLTATPHAGSSFSNWSGDPDCSDGQVTMNADKTCTATFTMSSSSGGTAVAAGWLHTCAVLSDGSVKCWGYNYFGQLGDGTNTYRTTPVSVVGMTNTTALAAGNHHTCAVLFDGSVKCWGYNRSYGQLGDGTNTDRNTPVYVVGITNATAVAAGEYHTCAALSDGSVKCWGDNGGGRLGDGTNTNRNTPVSVVGITNATAVAAGSLHTCALLSTGAIKCWGSNSYGQLGDGTNNRSNTPVSVMGITNATAVAAGGNRTCALLSGGSVKCWGPNGYGQLGDGTNTGSNTPISVLGITNAVAVAAGNLHTCALLSDGSVKCWGYNGDGQLGDGTNTSRSTPVSVVGITNATAVAAGYYHTCAVLSDGSVKCWGSNYSDQLGDGTNNRSNTPVSVVGITNAVAVAAGDVHTCALLSDGSVKCWGDNYFGQLGDGKGSLSNTPVSVVGITNAMAVTAGGEYTCAVLSGGSVKCWGYNGDGQLGDGTNTSRSTPVSVVGITDAVAVAAGYYHTCAVLSDGSVKCWGDNNYGQLGDGTTTRSNTPVSAVGITNAVAVAAGRWHTCAVLSGGSVKCWGYNGGGQLGDGTYTDRNTPVSVVGITNAMAVTAGGDHTCAVLSGGSVKCWGINYYGQLGDGTNTPRNTPVSVVGITNAVTVAAGGSNAPDGHTCAILSDSSMKCWGYNWYGQLGDGTGHYRNTPVSVVGIP